MPGNFKANFNKQKFNGPYQYLCIEKTDWAEDRDEDSDADSEDSLPEDEDCKAAASKYPAHKWIMMRRAAGILCEHCIETTQSNPDNYGMHVYTDYFPYAVIDLIARLCKSADTALKARDLHKAWADVAALGHYLNNDCHRDYWLCADDGDDVQMLADLIGRTILTALDAVQQVGQLKKDSKFKDLGLVMGLYFRAPSSSWADIETVLEDVSGTNWREAIVAYAMEAEINLRDVGVADIEEALSQVHIEPFPRKNGNWKLSSSMNRYLRSHHSSSPFWSGDSFNICEWTREERAKFNFDHKDPLKDFPEDLINNGEVVPEAAFR